MYTCTDVYVAVSCRCRKITLHFLREFRLASWADVWFHVMFCVCAGSVATASQEAAEITGVQ
jgi:hypothetical protein